MKKFFFINALFLMSFMSETIADSLEEEYLLKVLKENVRSTDISAMVMIEAYDIYRAIRNDKGAIGYITYKFTGNVLRVWKGNLPPQAEWFVTYERDIEPKLLNEPVIVSLCAGEGNILYVPDNGYIVLATPRLLMEIENNVQNSLVVKNSEACERISS